MEFMFSDADGQGILPPWKQKHAILRKCIKLLLSPWDMITKQLFDLKRTTLGFSQKKK